MWKQKSLKTNSLSSMESAVVAPQPAIGRRVRVVAELHPESENNPFSPHPGVASDSWIIFCDLRPAKSPSCSSACTTRPDWNSSSPSLDRSKIPTCWSLYFFCRAVHTCLVPRRGQQLVLFFTSRLVHSHPRKTRQGSTGAPLY